MIAFRDPASQHMSAASLSTGSAKKLRAILAQIRSNSINEAFLADLGLNKFVIKEIQESLVDNFSLITINMARNQLADEGARMFSQLLKQGKLANLVHLDLANNGISKDGARELVDSLESNFVMETLYINETQKTSLAIKDVQFKIDSSAFDALYGTSQEQARIRHLLEGNIKLKKVRICLRISKFQLLNPIYYFRVSQANVQNFG